MPQSLAKVLVHIVFSTKHRFPFLTDPATRREMHAYLGGTLNALDCHVLVVGGIADHVHILCSLSRKRSIADIMKELKGQSSKWVKTRGRLMNKFEWQRGYGIFSVNAVGAPELCRYIAGQEEHHRMKSFQVEYRLMLEKYQMEYDERYVWD